MQSVNRGIISLMLILFLAFNSYAQLDSLQKVLQSNNISDSLRVALHIELALLDNNSERCFENAKSAVRLAGEMEYDFLRANSYFTMGRLMAFYNNDYDSAKHYYELARRYFDPEKDKNYLADIIRRTGHFYSYQDNHAMAMEMYLQALDVFEEVGDQLRTAHTYNDIANSNNYLGAHEKALEDYQKALNLYNEIADAAGEAMVLSNMAIIYCEEDQIDDCKKTYKNVIEIYKALGNKASLGSNYTSLGALYIDTDQRDSAYYYLKKGESLIREAGDTREMGFNRQFLGQYYTKIGDYDNAIAAFKAALQIADQLQIVQLAINNNGYLAEAYELKKDFENALKYHKIEDEISDSVFTLSQNRQFNEIQAKYENARQAAENQKLKNEAELQKAQLQRQKIYNTSLAVIVFIILISAIVLFVAYRKILSQKKQAEKDREIISEQAAKLEKSDQLKSKFFGNISHELRTPLTILLGMIENLSKSNSSKLSDEDKEKLELAKSHGGKIQKLIDEVFELTKMEVNNVNIDAKSTRILPVLERIVFSFHSLAEEKKIDLNISYGQIHNIHVDLDISKFEKIINNLIINALKFTPEEGTVTVKVSHNQDRNFLIIDVQDTGIGIPEEELKYIFDRFYQVSLDGTLPNPGTGLGLAMAKELTELHGGTITATSMIGQGSVFSVALPVSSESINPVKEDSAINKTEQLLEYLMADINASGLNKIMIVEDNPDMREYLNIVFKDDFKLVFCQNGEEALEKLKHTQVSLIISDLMMPKMDGATLLENLKADEELRQIPVIILTAKLGEQDKLHALRMGVDDYITKPFSAEEIKVRVQVLIKNYLSRRQWHQKEDEIEVVSSDDDNLIVQIRDYIKANIGNYNINIAQIADHLAMSERQLYRKIGTSTGLTPNQLIREIKLQYAMELLQKKAVSKVSALSKEVGFESSAYFSRLFFERFGKKPQAYLESA